MACALIASLTAVGWCLSAGNGWLLRVRAIVMVLALVTVGLGWWLAGVVSAKREPRNNLTDQVILGASPTHDDIQAAEKARADFGMWHGFSLIQNFATLLLVAGAMGLAAKLPTGQAMHRIETQSAAEKKELVVG
jgi:hypothetical protein